MQDGRYPFRVSVPGQPPLDATLVISGRSWSVTMYPWDPASPGSPLTIAGESDDARAALSLLAGSAAPASAPTAASSPGGSRPASTPAFAPALTVALAAAPALAPAPVSAPTPNPTRNLPPITDGTDLGSSAALDVVARLQVYQADSPKVRLGGPDDGGYVLPESLLREASCLVSIGIAGDSGFEEDWFELTGKPVEMYDGSGDCPAICSRWPAERDGRIRYMRQFVGNDRDMVSLGSVLEGRHDVLLKMDAEGAEYHTLPLVDLSGCAGILLEAHFLNGEHGQREFAQMLDQLNRDFVLVHLHGNNCCGSAPLPAALAGDGDGLPTVLELTFVNRRVHRAPLALTEERFPVAGLDGRNTELNPILTLEWVNRYRLTGIDGDGAGAAAATPNPAEPAPSGMTQPGADPGGVRARMDDLRAAGPVPDPGVLLAARSALAHPRRDRAAFAGFAAFAEPLAPFSAAPDFDDLWALWEARGRNAGTFVELGAGDGEAGSASVLLERRAFWSGILVESDPALAEAARLSRGCVVLQAWPAATAGDAALVLSEADGRRRLTRIEQGRRPSRRKQPAPALTVPAMTLDEILRAGSAPERIDVLFLRTGDAALDLLRGLDLGAWDVGAIAVGPDAGPDDPDLARLLEDAGFRPAWPAFSEPSRWFARA